MRPSPRPARRRVALVTGSARGIGRAILERLAVDHDCVVHGRRDTVAAQEVAQVVRGKGAETLLVLGDLADPEQVAHLAEAVLERFDRLDTLVANAAATAFRPPAMISGQVITVDGGISAQGGPWGAMRDLW